MPDGGSQNQQLKPGLYGLQAIRKKLERGQLVIVGPDCPSGSQPPRIPELPQDDQDGAGLRAT